jgi:phospholipid/cholesterol/gamma-HCH transport system substrate-binding protein
MEKDANYALVGLSTIILFLGLVIFGIWLARIRLNHEYDVYDILFQGPVRGISQGSEVHFNGIKVGEVTKIALQTTNTNNVVARARVTSNVPIRIDSYATLEPLGITGLNYIQITAGTPTKPLLKDVTPTGKIPVLRTQNSTLSDLLEGGGNVLSRTVEALDRVNRVLSDQNIKTLTATLSDAQAITAELRERRQIIADAQKAVQDADAAIQEVTELTKSTRGIVEGDGKRTMKNVADAADEAKQAAAELKTMMAKLQGPTSDFATNGLPQLTAATVSLQNAAESLDRLAREAESNPRALVSKAPAAEKKVKP